MLHKYISNFTHNKNIDFFKYYNYIIYLSIFLIITSALSIIFLQFNKSIDFSGGKIMQVRLDNENIDIASFRNILLENDINKFSLQRLGSNSLLIKIQSEDKLDIDYSNNNYDIENIKKILSEYFNDNIIYEEIDYIGPSISSNFTANSIKALIIAIIFISIYISFRFDYRFAIGAIIALFHDIIFLFAFFAITKIEIGFTSIAAILTIIGYSVNDTVVIFDRIRENLLYDNSLTIKALNKAINQTLSRTLMTSISTILVILTLIFSGSKIIASFGYPLLFGVIIGTFSSIYVAPISILKININKKDNNIDDKKSSK